MNEQSNLISKNEINSNNRRLSTQLFTDILNKPQNDKENAHNPKKT